MYYIYIPPPQTAAAALTPEEFDDLAGKTNDFSAEKDGADGDDELPVADPPSFTRNRNIERNGGKPPAKASASSSSSSGKPANKFEVCIYKSQVEPYACDCVLVHVSLLCPLYFHDFSGPQN